jgi:hypothetical protein
MTAATARPAVTTASAHWSAVGGLLRGCPPVEWFGIIDTAMASLYYFDAGGWGFVTAAAEAFWTGQ